MNILAERALNSVEQGLLNAPPSALGFKTPKPKPKPKPKSKSSKSRSKQQQQEEEEEEQENEDEATDPAEAARIEVESGTHQLETLLCASIDRNFDKFEIYVLRNIFCVRPPDVRDWIRLSHYEGLDFSKSSSATASGDGSAKDPDVEMGGTGTGTGNRGNNGEGDQQQQTDDPDLPTLESIHKLRRRLRESMRLNALLTAEHARNERLLADLRHLVGGGAAIKKERGSSASGDKDANGNGDDSTRKKENKKSPFAFLHDRGDLTEADPNAPLSTNTAFTLSQMQALRALSTSLRTLAPDLGPPLSLSQDDDPNEDQDKDEEDEDGSGSGSGTKDGSMKKKKKKKTWRRERLEYVEAATRRHLESVQGLELGRAGDVRDGEWQGEGRGLPRGEVEGLERLASLLGAAEQGRGAGAGEGGRDRDEGGNADEGPGAGTDGDADRMDES